MAVKAKNDYGEITIENEVIARIAGQAAVDCYGVVGMAARGVKDGIVQLLKKESLTKGVAFAQTDAGASVTLHIIVRYGTNIPAICESLIDSVKYNIEEFAGINVIAVDIFVEGINVDKG